MGGELAKGEDGFDLLEFGSGVEGLLEAEGVEALADGHGADGVAGLDADFAMGGVGRGLLEDDLVADALDDGVDRVAEDGEGLAGESTGAGFGAREGALVEEQDALAGSGEVVGGGAAGGAGAGDEDVVGVRHGELSV